MLIKRRKNRTEISQFKKQQKTKRNKKEQRKTILDLNMIDD